MERQINFARDRVMLCGICGHQWAVSLDWIHRWEQAEETCPGCGTTCERENAPRVTVSPSDPALNDACVAQMFWYHTSTQPDWPTNAFDPAAHLTPRIRQSMGGSEGVDAWAARQRAKALHLGTYEAAVHNMLRRIRNQADHASQFFLYRVHLTPSVVVRDGWVVDPSDFVGDVELKQVCPPGIDVTRYLNYHEDPGGLSLAMGRGAIASVQTLAVPVLAAAEESWVRNAAADLEETSETVASAGVNTWAMMRPASQRTARGREIAQSLIDQVPINIRDEFANAVAFTGGEDPTRWARKVAGIFAMIEAPDRVLAALDGSARRLV